MRTVTATRFTAALLMGACASPPPVADAAPANAAPASDAPRLSAPGLIVPPVMPAMPSRPSLDLGPVLILRDPGDRAVSDLLLAEGQRLGADGFVLERRALGAVYGLDASRQAQWRQDHPGLSIAANVARYLLTGMLTAPTNANVSEERAFYRAYRYVDDPPPPVPVTSADLEVPLRDALAKQASLQEQLDLAHGLLGAELLDAEAYDALRILLLRAAGA